MNLPKTDKPVELKDEDKFQRYSFAKRIAEIVSINNNPTSIVLGIYGKWGEGKTSVLNFIREEIPTENTAIINFNPWHFNDETQLMQAFFSSIAIALNKKLISKKKRALDLLSSYGESVGSLSNLIIPGSGIILTAGKQIAKKLQKETIEDLKKKIDSLIIEADINFAIFIDDIDRLNVEEVQAVFKLVKLLGDFPKTAYILSFDDDMVAAALGPKYGNQDKTSGYAFLEKIIQIPLHLPKANKDALRNYFLAHVNTVLDNLKVDISETESRTFLNNFDQGILPVLTNPRSAIRFSNSISFILPLLIGEVYTPDLLIIECIKVFYPSLYDFIKVNPHLFTRNYSSVSNIYTSITQEDKNHSKETIEKHINQFGDISKSLLSLLNELFPQVQSLFRNTHYTIEHMNTWYRERKICSSRHFDRYFSYVVKDGDISDVYFKELLLQLNCIDIGIVKDYFRVELPKMKSEGFVFKLKSYIITLNEVQSKSLSIVLAANGEYFPISNQIISFTGRGEIPYIIIELLKKIQKSKRAEVCTEVLRSAQPFELSIEILNSLRYKQNNNEDNEIFLLQDPELNLLIEVVLQRFDGEYQNRNPFQILQDNELLDILQMYFDIQKANVAKKLLYNELENTENSLRVIKVFTPSARSSGRESLEPYKTGFTLNTYENISKFIEPKILYDATLNAFGKKTFFSLRDPNYDELTDDNLIAIFQKTFEEQESSKRK